MLHSWPTLLPPLIVILGAIITKRIHSALIIGIVSAAFIGSNGDMSTAIELCFTSLWNTLSDIDNLYLYAFLIVVGMLVALFTITGAATSFARSVTNRIRTKKQAHYASLLVSILLFIDDYLSILTTGYVISPITDRFQIAREKLAYLVHSFAGPIVILAPISSWVAIIVAYLDQVGVTISPHATNVRIAADPFFIFLQSIPFIFYSLLTIATAWIIIRYSISFGPMKQYETQATLRTTPRETENGPAYMSNLLFPLGVLVGGIIIGLPTAGGYWLFGGPYGFIDAIKFNKHPFLVMLIAALCAVVVGFIRCYQRSLIKINDIPRMAYDGYALMIEAITMVYLASTLSAMLANHVGTGQYLASLLVGSVPLWLLPAMFFMVSLICTIATGSAWGNFALMIPIAIPMLTSLSGLATPIHPHDLSLLLPVLGAILSGSVCGDHISPLSETTTMTATSTGTNPITHAYTQFFYAIPAIASSLIGFVVAGYVCTTYSTTTTFMIAGGTSLISCIALIYLCARHGKN